MGTTAIPEPGRRFGAALAGAVLLLACSGGDGPGGPEAIAYVGRTTCAECHPREHAAWRGSHHDLAMQVADEESVLGDFDDAVFEHLGQRTRFFRRDGRFLVRTEGADGERADFEVRYVFGAEPLQQLLVDLPGGRLQCLTVAWDTEGGRWFSLHPDERREAGDPFHWTGLYLRWNAMCAECHSTNLVKGYDAEGGTYRTTWSEIDVACETCHGPGGEHVRRARGWTDGAPAGIAERGLVVELRRGASRAQIDACAPCHARRTQIVAEHAPGGAFLDDFLPVNLVEGLYHADGQILDEVYVYGSFVQSRMQRAGVACTDCHDPHSLDLLVPGNAVCTQCHSPFAPLERFPTLGAGDYDTPGHHHHAKESEGARCVSCHMPERTYMVVDPRRDHRFGIPRPDLTLEAGTPNACNGCHADRSAAWAAAEIAGWTGGEPGPHFASAFARARAGDAAAGAELARLAGDADQAPIVRATALDLLRAYAPFGRGAVGRALDDPEPLVRISAARWLETLPPGERLGAVGLLGDPLRTVRTEAARVLAAVAPGVLAEADRGALEAALAEYRAAQEASADLPWSRLNLAVLHEERGETGAAEEAYRRALSLDPGFLPARFNLANLLDRLGRGPQAASVLRGGIALAADEGELHYSLGLVLAGLGRLEEASEALVRAAELLPGRARVRYNAGLALQGLDRLSEAEALLLEAVDLAGDDPEIRHALVVLLARRGEWQRALPHAERLLELVPAAPDARALLGLVRAELAREEGR